MAHADSGDKKMAQRPLSPHLQIYSPRINMVMSIVHRITGFGLYFGTILLAWWLIAMATGPESFAYASAFFGSIIGKIILFGYTWALLHHMLGGIRHFIWDTARGMDIGTVDTLSWATIIGSVVLTVVIWLVAGLA